MALRVKKITPGKFVRGRFRPTGPSLKNPSYRKIKKEAQRLQHAGKLEPGPMFKKWRKATGVSKRGRKRKRT